MKKLIAILALVSLSFGSYSQNAKLDASGNYIAVSSAKSKEPAKNTGKVFTDKSGKQYTVYISAKGKLFYKRISKNGKEYNAYLSI